MKSFLISRFKGRSFGFYLSFASAALMFVCDILYIATDHGDYTFSVLAFALLLVGSLLTLAYCLAGLKFLDFIPAVSCILYGFGFGSHLTVALESLSDVWNGVNFVGGNAMVGLAFIILFAVALIAAVVAAFLREENRAS